MENLKCRKCLAPMVEVEKVGHYIWRSKGYAYRYKTMMCEAHKIECFQTEAQMRETLETINNLKARLCVKQRQ